MFQYKDNCQQTGIPEMEFLQHRYVQDLLDIEDSHYSILNLFMITCHVIYIYLNNTTLVHWGIEGVSFSVPRD